MEIALQEARAAAERGEVPVGAVVLGPDGAVLARAGNRVEADHDASAHAELLALRAAAVALGDPRLTGCDLFARIFDAPSCHHRPEIIGGVRESEAAELLRTFFSARR